MSRIALAIVCCVAVGCANIHSVDGGRLVRCAQLDADDYAELIEEYGIRTVVRLRGGKPGDEGFDATRLPTEAAGATFVHLPTSATRMPERDYLVNIWRTIQTAEYPMLVHCKAGADRTGLASALYVLHRTGDLRLAKEQLHTFPYLHMGWGRTDAMDQVLEQYEPYAGVLDFGDWAATIYRK